MPHVFYFPNSSIAGIALAMLLLFIIAFIPSTKKRSGLVILFIIAAVLFTLLLFSRSRSGWLGFAAGLSYIIYRHLPPRKRRAFLLAAAMLQLVLFCLLLLYKTGSSAGRRHIYSISFQMLQDKWPQGAGRGRFKALFNEYQADYFSRHDLHSQRALLADNSFYAFNDYLQWVIETGIAGMLVLIIVLYFFIQRAILLHRRIKVKALTVAATSSLIVAAVAALFSYPLQVRAIQLLVLVAAGTIAFLSSPAARYKWNAWICRAIVCALCCRFVYSVIHDAKRKQWEQKAFDQARTGFTSEAISSYARLADAYPWEGYNRCLYAQRLYYAGRLVEAKQALATAMQYYTDNNMYRLKAAIEKELGDTAAAEQSCLRALYMVPNRLGSRYDLVEFYLSVKDTGKAVYWCNDMLRMKVKVPSARADSIKRQTERILGAIDHVR